MVRQSAATGIEPAPAASTDAFMRSARSAACGRKGRLALSTSGGLSRVLWF
jgi:hypothetical protein